MREGGREGGGVMAGWAGEWSYDYYWLIFIDRDE